MGAYDFLQDPNFTPVAETGANLAPQGGIGGFLSNPANLRLMAEMGSRFGAGGAGEAIGVPTSQMIRSQQMGQAAEKQTTGQGAFMDKVLQALGGGDLSSLNVTPQGDMKGIDSLSLNDKGLTIKMPRPGGQSSFGTNKALEMGGSQQPQPSAPVQPTGQQEEPRSPFQ